MTIDQDYKNFRILFDPFFKNPKNTPAGLNFKNTITNAYEEIERNIRQSGGGGGNGNNNGNNGSVKSGNNNNSVNSGNNNSSALVVHKAKPSVPPSGEQQLANVAAAGGAIVSAAQQVGVPLADPSLQLMTTMGNALGRPLTIQDLKDLAAIATTVQKAAAENKALLIKAKANAKVALISAKAAANVKETEARGKADVAAIQEEAEGQTKVEKAAGHVKVAAIRAVQAPARIRQNVGLFFTLLFLLFTAYASYEVYTHGEQISAWLNDQAYLARQSSQQNISSLKTFEEEWYTLNSVREGFNSAINLVRQGQLSIKYFQSVVLNFFEFVSQYGTPVLTFVVAFIGTSFSAFFAFISTSSSSAAELAGAVAPMATAVGKAYTARQERKAIAAKASADSTARIVEAKSKKQALEAIANSNARIGEAKAAAKADIAKAGILAKMLESGMHSHLSQGASLSKKPAAASHLALTSGASSSASTAAAASAAPRTKAERKAIANAATARNAATRRAQEQADTAAVDFDTLQDYAETLGYDGFISIPGGGSGREAVEVRDWFIRRKIPIPTKFKDYNVVEQLNKSSASPPSANKARENANANTNVENANEGGGRRRKYTPKRTRKNKFKKSRLYTRSRYY